VRTFNGTCICSKKAILAGMYAVIDCDAVEVGRLADQSDMWIDDEELYNAQANPLATKLAHHFSTISHPDTGNPCPAGRPAPGWAGPGFRAGIRKTILVVIIIVVVIGR
jgi:hypothetical protein